MPPIPDSFRRPAAAIALTSTLLAGCVASAMPALAAQPSMVSSSVSVVAPAGLSVAAGNAQLTAKWKSSSDATVTGYLIEVSRSDDFPREETLIVPVSGRTATSKVLTGLHAGTTYHVRIASVTAAGVGAFSTAVKGSTFTVPGVPTSVKATAGNKAVTVSWVAPTVNGGSAVTGYQVDYSTDATFASGVASVNVGAVTSTTISGLVAGTTYYVRVQAKNVVGFGAESSVANVATWTVPAAPAAPTLTRGNKTLAVKWVAPATGGSAITGYTVQYSTDSTFTADVHTVSAASTSATLSSLAAGTTYFVRVLASNVVGASAYGTAASSSTFAVPGVVSNVKETAGNGQVAVTWTAPVDNGGSAVTGYRLQYSTHADFSAGVSTVDTGSTSAAYTIKGLTPGSTIFVRVAALNAVGAGSYVASASSATTFTVPGVATSVTATKGAGLVTVKWVAPANKGGTTLSGYDVQVSTSSTFSVISAQVAAAASAVSANVTGLQPGTLYYARVIAKNVVGSGQASAVASATTSALPGAPTGLTAATVVTGGAAVKLTWKASTVLDGATVTGYVIQYSKDSSFASGVSTVKQTGTGVTGTVSGLEFNSTYYFRVATVTGAGQGAFSAGVSGKTAVLATAPQDVKAVAAGTDVTVSWKAPASAGSSAVTGYEVVLSAHEDMRDPIVRTVTGLSTEFLDLNVDTKYYVEVFAKTAVGTGAASAKVHVTTEAPLNITYPNNGHITYTYESNAVQVAPTVDGGYGSKSYEIVSGTLPEGVTFNPATGVFTGPAAGAWKVKPVQVALGTYTSYALMPDGTVQAMGDNNQGQFGNGQTGTFSLAPVTIPGLQGVSKIFANGNDGAAILHDGTVVGWGPGLGGDNGAVQTIAGLPSNVESFAIGAGQYSAVTTNGDVYVWGNSYYFGDGRGDGRNVLTIASPTKIMSGVASFSMNYSNGIAVMTDGSVKVWGSNKWGQLGTGGQDSTAHPTPMALAHVNGAKTALVGKDSFAVLLDDGTVKTVGANSYGSLGNGTASDPNLEAASVQGVHGAKTLVSPVMVLTSRGEILGWGDNRVGQLGNGTVEDMYTSAVEVNLKGAVQVASNGTSALSVMSNGAVDGWGYNAAGQLGSGLQAGVRHDEGGGYIWYEMTPESIHPTPEMNGAYNLTGYGVTLTVRVTDVDGHSGTTIVVINQD